MDTHIYIRLKVSETHGVKVCMFDKKGVELYDRYTWTIVKYGNGFYLRRHIKIDGKRTTIVFHRELLNIKDENIVDHISGNGLDNRLINLRPATHQQNTQNQRMYSTNTSGVKGVHWNKERNNWEAQLSYNKKQMYLGLFINKQEAEQVVRERREQLHGEFANHG